MAKTYDEKGKKTRTITERKRKLAMDISPKNLKNLEKRLKMDDFTGGDQLDDIILKQRKQKKNMKGKGKA